MTYTGLWELMNVIIKFMTSVWNITDFKSVFSRYKERFPLKLIMTQQFGKVSFCKQNQKFCLFYVTDLSFDWKLLGSQQL